MPQANLQQPLTSAVDYSSYKLDDLITEAKALKDDASALDKQAKEKRAEFKKIEHALLEKLDDQGLSMTRGTKAKVAVSESTLPSVTDWDLLYEYILKERAFHLLQRRASATAYRELIEGGESVPGVETYTERKLSVTKI